MGFFRAKIIFGLNALAGKSIKSGSAVGPWNYTNAESFIRYTVGKNYTIHGWELGKYMLPLLQMPKYLVPLHNETKIENGDLY